MHRYHPVAQSYTYISHGSVLDPIKDDLLRNTEGSAARNHVWLKAYLAAVRKEPQRLVGLLVFPQALVLRCP